MGQRVRSKKNGKPKGTAVKRTGGSNPNNYITVGNVTLRGGGKTSGGSNRKVKKRRKRA